MAELLARIPLTIDEIARMPRKLRTDVVELLVRWRAFDEAEALLARWPDDGYVSTLDLRARTLSGLGRHAEALAIMGQRLEQKESVSARGLYGRLLFHSGALAATAALVDALLEQNRSYGPLWSLLGDLHLHSGALDDAEAAYLEHRSLAPNSRQPDVGLARVALARRDSVTAVAFAVRAATLEGVEYQASVDQLMALRDLFTQLDERNHLADIEQQLLERLEAELADLRVLLDDPGLPADARPPDSAASAAPRRAQPRPAAGAALPEPDPPPVQPLEAIPVSPESLARFSEAAQRLFGFAGLRPAQPEILACVERGEDVLAILPTGAGKSLTYQLSAFLDDTSEDRRDTEGGESGQPLTLVISPLIALMKDQIDGLPVPLQPYAIALNSSFEGDRLRTALVDLRRGRYRLLYVAPERLRQRAFLDMVRRRGVKRLVIDEAHCVSVWGHNFRPDYLYIAQAHRQLGAPPVLALTATAPPRVRQDIERQLFGAEGELSGRTLRRIALDSYRPNLLLGAKATTGHPEKQAYLLQLCTLYQGSGIVYARARQQCEELAALLRAHGHDAHHYHAGMGDGERAAAQEAFMQGRTRIMVATVAFGMGVDKPDIRFIIHYGLPSSLEAYYQEAGRAGRDGHPAHCVLLYAPSDKAALTALARQDAVTIEMLRTLYRAIRTRAGTVGTYAAMAGGDLQREAGLLETPFRVALSMLEQSGMIARADDVPVTVSLRLTGGGGDPALRAFAERASLQPGFRSDRDFMALAATTGYDPATLERTLLDWQASGALDLQSSGRSLLVCLLPAPRDSEARVQGLLSRIEAVQQQQAVEIYKYAQAHRCRHGHLSNYLNGQPRKRCGHCDNCGGLDLSLLEGSAMEDGDIDAAILRALAERMMGPKTFLRVLSGDSSDRLDEKYRRMACYGALRFARKRAIEGRIDTLLERGLIEMQEFDSGASIYRLTSAGWAAARVTAPAKEG